jgi:ectoine hydroxylase-related dioxygenase (phytanoyl-CoA dioxygenase family)
MDQAVTELSLDRADFEEAIYFSRYPDIAAAIARGDVADGWTHYVAHGRAEGRSGSALETEFYLRSYPLAAREIADGLAADAREHYRLLGRARGYLPRPTADRPADAARMPEFGGFWVDRPDALDAVAGRLETGRITEDEARQLQFWITHGYIILPGAIPPALADSAAAELDRAYRGDVPGLLFECGALGRGHMSYRPELNDLPAKALDLHCFSETIRQTMFAPAVTAFLELIFESRAFASQSLTFLRGSAQEPHQDSAYVAYTIPRRFAASWIALEDVTIGAGELFYYDGSHHLPDFLYGGDYKSVSEAERCGATDELQAEIAAHVNGLGQRAVEMGLKKSVFAAKKGDALIWHADLVHGGNPISTKATRKSLVTHYCPKRLAPLFAERVPTKLEEHAGHLHTTSHAGYGEKPAKKKRK